MQNSSTCSKLKTAAWLPACAALYVLSGSGASAQAAPARESASNLASARAETDNYLVELKSLPSYKPGVEGAFEVFLTSKGNYHTNAQYPYRFKTGVAPDGITYTKPNLVRADGSFEEEKKGSFKVPFVAARAGKYVVGGTFSLSVCSNANCIMEKVVLDTTVDVK